ncbi:hypothetical protein BC2230_50431 [Burkholderia cepacia]
MPRKRHTGIAHRAFRRKQKAMGGLHLAAKQSRAHQETMDGFWAWTLLSSFGDRVTVPAERAYIWLFNS